MVCSQKKILIIEDNFDDRYVYSRYLQKDAADTYKVIESDTGEEGLELYHREHPDLLLLDFFLPDMDGLELIQELKTSCNRLPPIIMLTGGTGEHTAVQAMKAGGCDPSDSD